MMWYDYIGWIAGCALIFFSIAFVMTSVLEKEARAVFMGLIVLVPLCFVWFLLLTQLYVYRAEILGLGIVGIVLFGLILFVPFGKKGSLQIVRPLERLDERDIIFARMRYQENSEAYNDYYRRHPELKTTDDKVRRMPTLYEPGSENYHVINSPVPQACFDFLEDIRGTTEAPPHAENRDIDPERMSLRLKGLAKYYGGRDAGIAVLNEGHTYTHVGRGQGKYGDVVKLDHKFALVFTVEMDRFMVRQAPSLTVYVESANQYVKAATIAISIAYYIRSLGFSARAHIDGNYRIIVPPVAVDAGLGEIGRIGLLMTPNLGPRVRLGAVTTDMPLVPDKPISFGALDFCEACTKCAENCPSGAIPQGDKKIVRGVEKWFVNQEACYTYWRKSGTDCGVCMNVCPYSKPNTFVHNSVRYAAQHSVVARRGAKWADDFFYGRFPKSNKKPEWLIS
ncbi:MAG: reductive dehalogenase [Gemmatimonadota bacterium]|nr:MAG: reductive dehalogenase [Gemmatimonadota bacterium]